MEIPSFTPADSLQEMSGALHTHGVIIIENMLDSAAVNQINIDLQPHLDHAETGIQHINPVITAFFGSKTKHVAGVASKSSAFVDSLMCHPALLGLCDEILLPNCADYQLNLAHLMVRGPGAEPQSFHRDEDIWIHLPRPHKEVEIATMTAMVDFTEQNGATQVVPGSHTWEREREPEPTEIVSAVMKAGSSVVYLGSTLHGGGSNTTTSNWRSGMHMSYAVGWLRTEENNYLQTPPEIAQRLSTRARRLLGYSIHDAIKDRGGYLGMLELKDPMKALFNDD